ncbi:MAG: tetratricopeptide repeat protein [Planctomycetota bacterium]|nr:tetratricopeptide repeat protein [Planctomycetota bacterium]MCB9902010.1 tetratricopeptide repeat protein [Planctomycetota bacterium]
MAVGDIKVKAREALKRKQYELSTEMSQEYLGLQPDDEEAMSIFFQAARKLRETRGKSLFGGMLSKVSAGASKDPRKRMASCLRALAKNPEDKSACMTLGQACLDANAFGSAVVAFQQAAEGEEKDPEPYKRLGEALGRRGRLPEALDALSRAIQIAPRDQEAIKLRKNLAAEGALKVAGYETAQSSRDLIKDKDVARQLESEQRLQMTPEHAASELEQVQERLAENPGDMKLLLRAGDLLLQQGQREAALTSFEKALAQDRGNFDLSVRVGDLKLQPLKEAAARAREAARQAPGDAALQAAAAQAMKPLIEASLVEYGRRVKEHPLDLTEHFRLGQWLLQAERVDEALAEFQQTVRDPNLKVRSLRFQAKCFESKGILNLAAKKLEEAAQSFPGLNTPAAKEVHYDLADLLARMDRGPEARDIFERIVEEDASYRDVLQRLSDLSSTA